MLVPSLWKHPPISGLTKFLNPAFAGFSCLGDPPKSNQNTAGYAYARSLPLKAPPILRTDKFLNRPFAGFSCLGDPPKSKTLLNVPPYILFYNPLFQFLRRPKREREREKERKTTPFLKKSPGEKSNPPFFFYNSRAGLCRTKSTPLPEILGTRMRSLRPRSGGGGGGGAGPCTSMHNGWLQLWCWCWCWRAWKGL